MVLSIQYVVDVTAVKETIKKLFVFYDFGKAMLLNKSDRVVSIN